MPKISSKDATYHSAQDLIYALHNPAPAIPLVKLGYGNKEVLRALVDVFRKSTPPSSTSEGASQGVHPRKTQKGEPRKSPNKK